MPDLTLPSPQGSTGAISTAQVDLDSSGEIDFHEWFLFLSALYEAVGTRRFLRLARLLPSERWRVRMKWAEIT